MFVFRVTKDTKMLCHDFSSATVKSKLRFLQLNTTFFQDQRFQESFWIHYLKLYEAFYEYDVI